MTGPVFDPGVDRSTGRRDYYSGRRVARLGAHLVQAEAARRYATRWAETLEGVPADQRERIGRRARELGTSTTRSAMDWLVELAYWAGREVAP